MVSDFIFDGMALSDFGYFAIQEISEESPDVSAMSFDNIKSALSDASLRVAHKYDTNYTTTFTIMKNLCETDDDGYLTNDNISELTSWLARKQYKWFRLIDDDQLNNDEIWYKVQNKISKEYVGDHVIGLRVTVEASTPYGYTREIIIDDRIRYQTPQLEVNVISDEEGYIYPDVVLVSNGIGTLTLTNTYENRSTVIKNCVRDEIITIKGGNLLQISSSTGRDITNDFNYVFPRFCVQYENNLNVFTATLVKGTNVFYNDVSCKFTYRGIRKVGF